MDYTCRSGTNSFSRAGSLSLVSELTAGAPFAAVEPPGGDPDSNFSDPKLEAIDRRFERRSSELHAQILIAIATLNGCGISAADQKLPPSPSIDERRRVNVTPDPIQPHQDQAMESLGKAIKNRLTTIIDSRFRSQDERFATLEERIDKRIDRFESRLSEFQAQIAIAIRNRWGIGVADRMLQPSPSSSGDRRTSLPQIGDSAHRPSEPQIQIDDSAPLPIHSDVRTSPLKIRSISPSLLTTDEEIDTASMETESDLEDQEEGACRSEDREVFDDLLQLPSNLCQGDESVINEEVLQIYNPRLSVFELKLAIDQRRNKFITGHGNQICDDQFLLTVLVAASFEMKSSNPRASAKPPWRQIDAAVSSIDGDFASVEMNHHKPRTPRKPPWRDVVAWNSLVAGYGIHGFVKEAIFLLEEMIANVVSPSPVTSVSILGACSHAGLVQEGKMIFKSMAQRHGIITRAEHYACMPDLIGLAGQLDEAGKVVEEMRVEPGRTVWGSLLGACGKSVYLVTFESCGFRKATPIEIEAEEDELRRSTWEFGESRDRFEDNSVEKSLQVQIGSTSIYSPLLTIDSAATMSASQASYTAVVTFSMVAVGCMRPNQMGVYNKLKTSSSAHRKLPRQDGKVIFDLRTDRDLEGGSNDAVLAIAQLAAKAVGSRHRLRLY